LEASVTAADARGAKIADPNQKKGPKNQNLKNNTAFIVFTFFYN